MARIYNKPKNKLYFWKLQDISIFSKTSKYPKCHNERLQPVKYIMLLDGKAQLHKCSFSLNKKYIQNDSNKIPAWIFLKCYYTLCSQHNWTEDVERSHMPLPYPHAGSLLHEAPLQQGAPLLQWWTCTSPQSLSLMLDFRLAVVCSMVLDNCLMTHIHCYSCSKKLQCSNISCFASFSFSLFRLWKPRTFHCLHSFVSSRLS